MFVKEVKIASLEHVLLEQTAPAVSEKIKRDFGKARQSEKSLARTSQPVPTLFAAQAGRVPQEGLSPLEIIQRGDSFLKRMMEQHSWGKEFVDKICCRLKIRLVSAGECIINENDDLRDCASEMWMVSNGTVVVTKGDICIVELKPGAVFGEQGLLKNVRMATVRAKETSLILGLTKRALEEVLNDFGERARAWLYGSLEHAAKDLNERYKDHGTRMEIDDRIRSLTACGRAASYSRI
mmetsp:Transcript_3312/g.11996  ORF Transcript_3312/g.11996 Transcript_3312/m.11996 type:complete len:238 (+) Transcript_3312:691-1404(+)